MREGKGAGMAEGTSSSSFFMKGLPTCTARAARRNLGAGA